MQNEQLNKLLDELSRLPIKYQKRVLSIVLSTFKENLERARVEAQKESDEIQRRQQTCEHDFGTGGFGGGWLYEYVGNKIPGADSFNRRKRWYRTCEKCGYMQTTRSEPVEYKEWAKGLKIGK